MESVKDPPANTVLAKAQDELDHIVQFTALRCLLIAVVKEHPEKKAVLEYFQRMTTHLTKSMREKSRPEIAQADELFVQLAEGSAELAAQFADSSAYCAEKLEEHVQRFLEDCG